MSDSGCCVVLRGRVHLTPPMAVCGRGWGGLWDIPAGGEDAKLLQPGPGRFVGNSSQLEITPNMQSFEEPSWTGEDGPACGGSILSSIAVAMNLKCFTDRNLSAALFGETSEYCEAQRISNELLPVSGCLSTDDVLFFGDPLVDENERISINVRSSAQSYSLREGRDFMRTPMGARLMTPIKIPDGATVTASYTRAAGTRFIEAFTRSAVEVGVVYEGVNKLDGSAVVVQIFRLRLAAADALSLITEGIGELLISGSMLPVNSPAGMSRFFRIMRRDTAHACGVC